MKERLGMTEMRKAANRMTFGEVSSLLSVLINVSHYVQLMCISSANFRETDNCRLINVLSNKQTIHSS